MAAIYIVPKFAYILINLNDCFNGPEITKRNYKKMLR